VKTCLVMGFGRSGTSLMSGILHDAGYFMGNDLYSPRHSNPKGFFENALINGINERILEEYDYCLRFEDFPVLSKKWSPYKPGEGHRWLSYIPEGVEITNTNPAIEEQIKEVLSHPDFAFKDPRFNYTLPVWEPFLPVDTLFLCLVREPGITIQSVLKECETAEYLFDFAITAELAEKLWTNSYLHLLKQTEKIDPDRFIFIHYRQLLSGKILQFLSEILQVKVDGRFISPELNRVREGLKVSGSTSKLYHRLCDLASFKPEAL